MVPRAPSAQAFRISWPLRMPLSSHTSISLPTALTTSGKALMVDGALSSWRPPWLETISASAPLFTANSASSGSIMPLIISLPPHISLMRATSSQLRRGSNCSAVQDESDDKSPTFLAWPTILRKVRRSVLSIFMHHSGLVARLIILAMVGLGGAERPFLMSLLRWPSTCKSAVRISAEHLAACARLMRFSINSRSRIT